MTPLYIFDLDGTLALIAICAHRHFAVFGTLCECAVLQLSHCDGMIHTSQHFAATRASGFRGWR